jgi:hypothetical protein
VSRGGELLDKAGNVIDIDTIAYAGEYTLKISGNGDTVAYTVAII